MYNCLEPRGVSACKLLWPILALQLICFPDFAEPICTSDEEDERSRIGSEGSPIFFMKALRH